MENRTCKNCSANFTIEPDDFSFYEKMQTPPPTWCPTCRLKRRLAWCGYQVLYKRKCDFTGEMVITTHHPSSPYKVYRQDIWWSDKWDPYEYGREIDWSRPFLEQLNELLHEVPFPALYSEYTSMIRSEYCNAAHSCKDCYLCFRASKVENSAYLNLVGDIRDCIDCSYTRHDERGYGNVITHGGYQTFFCEDVVGSHDMWFCRSCVGCSDCIGCVNLSKKKYCIFNVQYTKEEYEAILKKYDFGSHKNLEEFRIQALKFLNSHPRKQFNDRSSTNTTGEYIYNSSNILDSYMVRKAENCRYCQFIKTGPMADCYDYTMFGEQAELIYESCWVGSNVRNVKFSVWNYQATDIEFSFGCHSSNNMFGCVGVRKGEYCILNKKYTKEEYLKITERLRKQIDEIQYTDTLGRKYPYGEMLPAELSPWAYNESLIMEWFPLDKEQAVEEGFLWRDSEPRDYLPATVELSDHIKDIPKDLIKEILKCGTCGKNYRVIELELDFYKQYNLPIPRDCSLCRDRARTKLLNPIEIHENVCAKCKKEIKTSWKLGSEAIVYCSDCYNKEVY